MNVRYYVTRPTRVVRAVHDVGYLAFALHVLFLSVKMYYEYLLLLSSLMTNVQFTLVFTFAKVE